MRARLTMSCREVARADWAAGRVVLGNEPAQRDARMQLEVHERRIEHGAADILEHDVEAFRRHPGHVRDQLRLRPALVVDRRVEAVPLLEPAAFLRAAGHAHDPAAGQLRDLADQGSDRARRSGDEHGLAVARPADVRHAAVGRQANGAERGKVPRHGLHSRRVYAAQETVRLRQGIILDRGHAEHPVARLEIGMAARGDAADRDRAQCGVERDRLDV